MAKTPQNLQATIMILFITFITTFLHEANSQQFSQAISKDKLGLTKMTETLTHLHFYFHDITGGTNPTAAVVSQSPLKATSKTNFGSVSMMDDPLTEGPDLNSKLVGKMQGIYGSSSLDEISYLMVLNILFVDEKYNGSTIGILGRNPPLHTVREMPIVGGSGVFRFARGYAEARPHSYVVKDGIAIAVVEYNVYILHYN
ncbi:OLC1v1038172C1 [Oldenlandia corymbosa var. corymbosa]|uniref:Dirigent protein n=1 Tax=Oldenlandia corymbosa var. corymbosa TaxID=529605 RepID=A0AAV1D1V5_OLDCO|nr:OLC1v1038172C1 [Oldenlandia corymbosa var. corymbosa]